MDADAGDKGIVVEDGPRFGMVGGSRTRRRRSVVAVDSGPEEVVSILSDDESVDPRLGHAPRKRLRSQTTSDTLAGQDDWDRSEIQVVVSTPDQSGASNSLLPASRSGSTVPGSVNRQWDAAEISERPNPEAASAASDEVETVNIIRDDLTGGYASDAQQSGERFRVIDGRLVRIGRENRSLQPLHETNSDRHRGHLNRVLGRSTDDDDEYMPGVDPFADAALAHQMLDLNESELDALGGTEFPDGCLTSYARGTPQALRVRGGGGGGNGDRGAPVSVFRRPPPIRASGTRRRVEESMRRLNEQQSLQWQRHLRCLNEQQNPEAPSVQWQRHMRRLNEQQNLGLRSLHLSSRFRWWQRHRALRGGGASGTRRRVEESMRRLNEQQNPEAPSVQWQRHMRRLNEQQNLGPRSLHRSSRHRWWQRQRALRRGGASGTRRRVEESMRRLNEQQNPEPPSLQWQRQMALQGGGGYDAMWLGELASWAMQESTNGTTGADYEANLRLDDSVPARRGATEEQIRAIESTAVQESDLKDLCSICISPFTKRGKLKRLPCGHGFHGRCISKWLKINSNCPNCKRRLDGSPSDS